MISILRKPGHLIALISIAAQLAGCGSPSLALAPDEPVEMSGRWYLDTAASDNTVATIRAEIKERRRQPVPGDNGFVRTGAPGATLDGLREALPPDDAKWLDIRQTRAGFSVDYDGLKKASYRNGQSLTVFDRAGTGTLSAGWSGDRYVIYNKYESAFTMRQEFERVPGDERLKQTIEIKSSRLKHNVVIKRYYDSEPG